VASAAQQPENQREHNAYDDAGDDGKVKDRALAAINNIAGQAAQREMKPARKQEHGADHNNNSAHNQQQLSELSSHKVIVASGERKRPMARAIGRIEPAYFQY
jgi:hypothetical protein